MYLFQSNWPGHCCFRLPWAILLLGKKQSLRNFLSGHMVPAMKAVKKAMKDGSAAMTATGASSAVATTSELKCKDVKAPTGECLKRIKTLSNGKQKVARWSPRQQRWLLFKMRPRMIEIEEEAPDDEPKIACAHPKCSLCVHPNPSNLQAANCHEWGGAYCCGACFHSSKWKPSRHGPHCLGVVF